MRPSRCHIPALPVGHSADLQFPTSLSPTSAPHGKPPAPPAPAKIFQPGVAIDWENRIVYVDARVVLREGPIEFLACGPGKEHESVLLSQASATSIYMALGLIGLEPGRPPRWNDEEQHYAPATGDLVDVSIHWEQNGKRQQVPGFAWMRDIEYARTPFNRPWMFMGSHRRDDHTLVADHTGELLSVVDMPGALLGLSRRHASRDADLWAEANTGPIPPLDSLVRLVLSPAAPLAFTMLVDQRGDLLVDGRYARIADAADLIKIARQQDRDYVQQIVARDALRADVRRVHKELVAGGIPESAVQFTQAKP